MKKTPPELYEHVKFLISCPSNTFVASQPAGLSVFILSLSLSLFFVTVMAEVSANTTVTNAVPAWRVGAGLVSSFVEQMRIMQQVPARSESEAMDRISKVFSHLVTIKAWSFTPKPSAQDTSDPTEKSVHLAFYLHGEHAGTQLLNGLIDSNKINLLMQDKGAYNITQTGLDTYRLTFAVVEDNAIVVKKLDPLTIVPHGIHLNPNRNGPIFTSWVDVFEKLSPRVELDKFLYFAVPRDYIVEHRSETPGPTVNHRTHCLLVGSDDDTEWFASSSDIQLFLRGLQTLSNRKGIKPSIQIRESSVAAFLAGMKDIIHDGKEGEDAIIYISACGLTLEVSPGQEKVPLIAFTRKQPGRHNYKEETMPLVILEMCCSWLFLVKRLSQIVIICDLSFTEMSPSAPPLPTGYFCRSHNKIVDPTFTVETWINSQPEFLSSWLKILHEFHLGLTPAPLYEPTQYFRPRLAWAPNCFAFFASDSQKQALEKFTQDNSAGNGVFSYNLVPEILAAYRRTATLSDLCERITTSSSAEFKLQRPVLIHWPCCEHGFITRFSEKENPEICTDQLDLIIRRQDHLEHSWKIPAPNTFSVVQMDQTNGSVQISGGLLIGIRQGDVFTVVDAATSVTIPRANDITTTRRVHYRVNNKPGLMLCTADVIDPELQEAAKAFAAVPGPRRAIMAAPHSTRLAILSADNDDSTLNTVVSETQFWLIGSSLLATNHKPTVPISRARPPTVERDATEILEIRIYRVKQKDRMNVRKRTAEGPFKFNQSSRSSKSSRSTKNRSSTMPRLPLVNDFDTSAAILAQFCDSKFVASQTYRPTPMSESDHSHFQTARNALQCLAAESRFYFTAPAVHAPGKTIVGCVPLPAELLPMMISLYYWQFIKFKRLSQVNKFIWDTYAGGATLNYEADPLAASLGNSFVAPNLYLQINKRPWLTFPRKIGVMPASVNYITYTPDQTEKVSNRATYAFRYGINSPTSQNGNQRGYRSLFHFVRMSPFFAIRIRTTAHLRGHGLNMPSIIDSLDPIEAAVKTGTDPVETIDFCGHFMGTTALDDSNNRFNSQLQIPPWIFVIMLVADPTNRAVVDVRFLEQSVANHRNWNQQGQLSSSNLGEYIPPSPTAAGTPVPVHIELLVVTPQ